MVICILLGSVGLLVRLRTDQNNQGDSSSGLALTTWIDGPPPLYYSNDGKPVWNETQILNQTDGFDFILSKTKSSGFFNTRLGLRLAYSSATSDSSQDSLFDYTFRVGSWL